MVEVLNARPELYTTTVCVRIARPPPPIPILSLRPNNGLPFRSLEWQGSIKFHLCTGVPL